MNSSHDIRPWTGPTLDDEDEEVLDDEDFEDDEDLDEDDEEEDDDGEEEEETWQVFGTCAGLTS